MEERRNRIIALACEHGPCSVRHIYYQAVVSNVPGITKDDGGYRKVSRLVLDERRSGRVPYDLMVDTARWMRKPNTWRSPADALRATATTYRRDLWVESLNRIEMWCGSESIASTVYDITDEWDVRR
jgi:hypothetical protein